MTGVGNAALCRSKKDVDRHVQKQLNSLNSEHEKKLKGLAIARMYFKVSEFELAKQFVSTFLSVNENSPEGRRLLGHCYDKLGNKEKAVAEYLKSLTATPNQPELLLLCCELMIDPSVKLNKVQAEKICKQTEDLYPYHPTVYKLKDRLLTLNGNFDPSKVESLLNAEISVRPEDVNLRIKQLKLYESSSRLSEAFSYIINIEKTCSFQKDNVEWYEACSQLCEAYKKINSVNWEFYSRVLPIYERVASLLICETKSNKQKNVSDCFKVLFRLDQALYNAIQLSSPQTEFYRSLIQHMSNQLYFLLASVILKSAKQENSISWHKSNQLAAPLYLMALAPPIDKQAFESISSKEFSLEQKSNFTRWELEGTRRIIESGFVLRAMIEKEDKTFIENVKLLCTNDWKINNYKKIFASPQYAEGISTSLFINYSPDKLVYSIPELIQYPVPKHMLSFEMSRPGSLHHLVWYGIQLLESENRGFGMRLTKDTVFPVGFGCKSFTDLPLAINSFSSANIESICQIDMNTFLYAAVLSVASFLDNQGQQKGDSKAPGTFPSDITDQLTTPEQENWWKSMYKIYSKNVDGKYVSQLRKVAVQGIESIRLIGNHGIDVQLMVYLAKNFASQSNRVMDNFLLKIGLEKRAVHYWENAIQLLERIHQFRTEHKSKNTLFDFQRKNLSIDEVNELLEEGRFYLACHLMNNEQNEEAIEALKRLHSPYASFYQAMIYKKMMKPEAESCRDNSLFEVNRTLMIKVKELLNVTKERLKKYPHNHPLYAQLKEEFDLQVEMDLNGTANSNTLSGEDYSVTVEDEKKIPRRKNYNKFGERSLLNTSSTPVKSPLISGRRVDDEYDVKVLNELKVAVQSQNVQCQTLGLQYYNMIETLRSMTDKVDKLVDNFNQTKISIFNKIDELSQNIPTASSTPAAVSNHGTDHTFIKRMDELEENLTDRINGMSELIRTKPDDLYDVYQENEDFDKIAYDQSCVSNAYNDQAALNFSTSQLPFSTTVPFQQLGLFNQVSQPNSIPAYAMAPNPNVNITSSDTLPTGPPVSQPPLSVIIPTHHILSGNITSEPQPPFAAFKFNNQSHSAITHGTPSSQTTSSGALPLIAEPFSFQPTLSTFKESFETSLNKSRNSATDDSYVEEHDPIPEFQPIIPLPDKIEEVTGEENDTVLFEKRAKLYKYVEKEWKEKGVGTLKILKNNDTNKVRLVMRREQVHKVCANHFLYDNMELKSKSDKAVIWSANDFSDAVQVQVENLCARFKTEEDCEEFKTIFNENKQPCSQNTSLVDDSYSSNNYNQLILETSKDSNDSCLKLSSENEKSLKHELGAFTFSTTPIVSKISTPKQLDQSLEKPKGLFSNLNFSTPVGGTGSPSFSSILSKSINAGIKTETDTSASFSSKPGLFSTNTSKSTEKSLFSLNKAEENSALSTPKLDFTSGLTATSYFSTLAKSSPNPGFTNSPDFKGFPGAGSTIFNVKTNPSPHAIIKPVENANNSSMNQSHEESEDFVPTAEFTPVIPLPEKVNVVTGEEGLEVVFDDRAKLLRFDPSTKEWKERGIGQMKILYHPKDSYYQLLMRRELVYKICCNQRLSVDLELKPVSSSDKAMSWLGQDFSEGECKKELFAIRFKTVEQLHVFRDKFNEFKEKVSNNDKTEIVETQSDEKPAVKNTLPKLNDLAQFKPKPGSWTCDACYLSNDASNVKCNACCTVKPGAVVDETTENKPTASGFTFGQTSFPSMFKFGDDALNSASAIPFVMPTFGTSSDVSFGSLNSTAGASKQEAATLQKKPLTWREESSGLVKYDSDKSDGGTDESDNDSDDYDESKSVVANDKAQFSLADAKIGKPLFSVNKATLKTPENLDAPEALQKNPTFTETENDKESVKFLKVQSLKDVISPADQSLAEDLKLPLSFFLYKTKKSKCKGCVGCEHDSDSVEEGDNEHEITSSKTDSEKEMEKVKKQDDVSIPSSDSLASSTNNMSQFNPTSFLFGNKSSGSMFDKTTPNAPMFGSKPVFVNHSIDSTKTDDTKSSTLFGSLSTAIPSGPAVFGAFTNTGSTELHNAIPQTSLFAKTDDVKSKTEGLFSFSPKSDSPFKFGELSKDSKAVFGQSLFRVTDKPPNEYSPKVNPWAGNSNLNKTTDEEKNGEREEENSEEVDNSHDPHFEPIIPLPDAIEVSTGEENETILFCERSKLFRKDGAEYKERGIGEMKVLFHPERNTYRLLFRREKVFKVVCNHLISPEIMLVPMKSTNKAFCWACMNTTEDNTDPQKELLAVRFKNEELADKFKQVFEDCVSKLSA